MIIRSTLLALALALPAAAQTNTPMATGQSAQGGTAASSIGSPAGAPADRLHAVDVSLRNAGEQLGGGGEPNWEQARVALRAAQQGLSTTPSGEEGQRLHREAQAHVSLAQESVERQNRAEAARHLRQAADSFRAVVVAMSGGAQNVSPTATGR